MKTLVIGLGNPVVRDDGVGLRVAEALEPMLRERPDVDVAQDVWGGLRLMERMLDYDRAVIVDAIVTGAAPGTIHRLSVADMPTQRSASAHDVNLPTALAFGRQTGAHLPADDQVLLVGIEAADILNFGEDLTPAVAAAVPRAVGVVLDHLVAGRGVVGRG